MDTAPLAVTGSWLRPATTDSAARHGSPAGVRGGGGLGSLAAGAAESLARGLVTCVFATGQPPVRPQFLSSPFRGMARGWLQGCDRVAVLPYLGSHRFVDIFGAAVGTVLGAITGGLLGLATETGVVRGTGIGGITGALVSMEVVDSYLAMCRSDEPAIWSVVYLDVIWSLLTGRLVREKVDPAVLSAVESQMSAVAAPERHGDGGADIFETGVAAEGLTRAAIDALPVVRLAECGELVACSVCLQEFEAGESARSLPVCRHTFHLPCIDGWLLRHASCPLCRRAV
ncbi:unnamed protein product [Urochloa decumbens]|uniref:RING-type domain-containing protein n=1 Tax=Urochloa decumbens TaxID=240449 RepID=A0ABC9G4W3_9POAL